MNKREKIAYRIVKSHLMLKVPVGYSQVRLCRQKIQDRFNVRPDDKELESILARFMDLTLYYFGNESVKANLKEEFYNIAEEVLGKGDYEEKEEMEDYEDSMEDRYER